jgi:hypothetical protein
MIRSNLLLRRNLLSVLVQAGIASIVAISSAHAAVTSCMVVGAEYTLLTAGTVSGTFAGYETNMPNLLGHFSYNDP